MEKHENPHGVLNRIHVLGKHHPAFALGADAEAEISKLLTDMLAAHKQDMQVATRAAFEQGRLQGRSEVISALNHYMDQRHPETVEEARK